MNDMAIPFAIGLIAGFVMHTVIDVFLDYWYGPRRKK
jgi:hypothetical protein